MALPRTQLWYLIRHISEYTFEPLLMGVFTTDTGAEDAKSEYISYYQTHPDPWKEQAYRKTHLETDITIHKYETELTFTDLAFAIKSQCDGFGQIAQNIDGLAPTFETACDLGRQAYSVNHSECVTTESGEHECSGWISSVMIDILPLNHLRFANDQCDFEIGCDKSDRELRATACTSIKRDLETAIESALNINTEQWLKGIKRHNEIFEKDIKEVGSSNRKLRSTDPPPDWPGHESLKLVKTQIQQWLKSYPENLYPFQLRERLHADFDKLTLEPQLSKAFRYILYRI